MTPEEVQANEEALKATAALYNAQNPTAETEAEAQARAAAAELNGLGGNLDHNGQPAVVADDPEAVAAAEAAKSAEAEAEAAKAAQESEDAKTPEEKEAEAAAAKAATDAERAEAAANKDGEWVTTDSKEFNAAQSLMKAAGMTPAEVALVFDGAMNSGDLSKVDMDLLVEKVGEDKANLVIAGFTRYVETEGQAVLERTAAVHEVVGGSDNWAKMVKWARGKAKGDTAFAGKVSDINDMMNGTSAFQAELAAKEFMAMYNADSGNSTVAAKAAPAVAVVGQRVSPATPTVEPMSARSYSEAVEEASRTTRGADLAAKLVTLRQARAAGRAKGI